MQPPPQNKGMATCCLLRWIFLAGLMLRWTGTATANPSAGHRVMEHNIKRRKLERGIQHRQTQWRMWTNITITSSIFFFSISEHKHINNLLCLFLSNIFNLSNRFLSLVLHVFSASLLARLYVIADQQVVICSRSVCAIPCCRSGNSWTHNSRSHVV